MSMTGLQITILLCLEFAHIMDLLVNFPVKSQTSVGSEYEAQQRGEGDPDNPEEWSHCGSS